MITGISEYSLYAGMHVHTWFEPLTLVNVAIGLAIMPNMKYHTSRSSGLHIWRRRWDGQFTLVARV